MLSKNDFELALAAVTIRGRSVDCDAIKGAELMIVNGFSEKEAAFELGVTSLTAFAPSINLAKKISEASKIINNWRKNTNKSQDFKWQSANSLLGLTAHKIDTDRKIKAAVKIKLIYDLDIPMGVLADLSLDNEKSRNSLYKFADSAKKALSILDAA